MNGGVCLIAVEHSIMSTTANQSFDFGTEPYASKRLDFDRFKAIFCTIKLIYEIKVPNMKIELSFVVKLSSI